MSSEDFDEDAEDAFTGSVAASSNGTIAPDEVQITNVTSVGNVTNSTARRHLSVSTGLKVSYNIAVIIERLGLVAETAMPRLEEVLTWAVGSTKLQASFNTLMLEAREAKGLNFSSGVTFGELVVQDEAAVFTVLETARPSSAPSVEGGSGEEQSSPDFVMFVVPIVVAVVIVLGAAAYCMRMHTAKKVQVRVSQEADPPAP